MARVRESVPPLSPPDNGVFTVLHTSRLPSLGQICGALRCVEAPVGWLHNRDGREEWRCDVDALQHACRVPLLYTGEGTPAAVTSTGRPARRPLAGEVEIREDRTHDSDEVKAAVGYGAEDDHSDE